MRKGLYQNGWVVKVKDGYEAVDARVKVVPTMTGAMLYNTEFIASLAGTPVKAYQTREDANKPWSEPKPGHID